MADLVEVLVCAFLYLTFSGGIVRIYSWLISLGPRFWGFLALFFTIFLCLFVLCLLDFVLAKINHRRRYGYVVYRLVRLRVYRPQRGAQVPPPGVPIQGGPMNPQALQMHAQPQLNGVPIQGGPMNPQVLQMHAQPQLNGVPIQGGPMNPQVLQMHAQPQLNGRLPHVQNHQRDIGLRQLHRPGFAEDGIGAPPLRRSERLRAKKQAEERVQPVLRKSARLQAKKIAEEQKAQNPRRITRNRAY